jgi:hypothetical protein
MLNSFAANWFGLPFITQYPDVSFDPTAAVLSRELPRKVTDTSLHCVSFSSKIKISPRMKHGLNTDNANTTITS